MIKILITLRCIIRAGVHYKIIRMSILQNLRNFNAHIMVAQHNFMFHEYFETLRLNLISASDVTCRKFKQSFNFKRRGYLHVMYLLLQYRPLRWSWGGKQAGQGNVYNDGYAIVLLQSYQTLTHPACYPPQLCLKGLCCIV